MKNILDQFHSMRAALHLAPGERRSPRRLHVIQYEDPTLCLEAVRAYRDEGFRVHDVQTPFPLHGMEEALGLRDTRLGWATFAGGFLGCVGAFLFQSWVHAVDWPLNIGGKSYLALPSQIVVAFELTILLAAFATFGALVIRSALLPSLSGVRPVSQPTPRSTDDRFVVVIEEQDASFDPDRFRFLADETGAVARQEGWRIS